MYRRDEVQFPIVGNLADELNLHSEVEMGGTGDSMGVGARRRGKCDGVNSRLWWVAHSVTLFRTLPPHPNPLPRGGEGI
jgi:hypothetical protein